MPALERGRLGLLPAAALALGLVSANAIPRAPAAADPPKAAHKSATAPAATTQTLQAAGGLADLRPVMALLAEALGIDPDGDATTRAARALGVDLAPARQQAPPAEAVGTLLDKLQSHEPANTGCEVPTSSETGVTDSARRLDGYLRSDIAPEARFHKLRDRITDKFLD